MLKIAKIQIIGTLSLRVLIEKRKRPSELHQILDNVLREVRSVTSCSQEDHANLLLNYTDGVTGLF